MSPLMEHGRPATSRNECGAAGQCFGTANNSLSNESFVCISAGSAAPPQALFHQRLQGRRGLICPPLSHPSDTQGRLLAQNYSGEVWTFLFLKPGNNPTALLTCNWGSRQVVSFLSHKGWAPEWWTVASARLGLWMKQVDVFWCEVGSFKAQTFFFFFFRPLFICWICWRRWKLCDRRQ